MNKRQYLTIARNNGRKTIKQLAEQFDVHPLRVTSAIVKLQARGRNARAKVSARPPRPVNQHLEDAIVELG